MWELSLAWDGYATAKGIKKPFDESLYPDEESRKRLRQLREQK